MHQEQMNDESTSDKSPNDDSSNLVIFTCLFRWIAFCNQTVYIL